MLLLGEQPQTTCFSAPSRSQLVPEAGFQAVDAWADTKLGAEGVVEVRHVAEAAIESDVKDSRRFRREPHRRLAQAGPENILVRQRTQGR